MASVAKLYAYKGFEKARRAKGKGFLERGIKGIPGRVKRSLKKANQKAIVGELRTWHKRDPRIKLKAQETAKNLMLSEILKGVPRNKAKAKAKRVVSQSLLKASAWELGERRLRRASLAFTGVGAALVYKDNRENEYKRGPGDNMFTPAEYAFYGGAMGGLIGYASFRSHGLGHKTASTVALVSAPVLGGVYYGLAKATRKRSGEEYKGKPRNK